MHLPHSSILIAQDLVWGGTIHPHNSNGAPYGGKKLVEFSNDGGLLIGGSFNGVYDTDPTTGLNVDTTDGMDAVIVKLDSLNNFQWAISFGDSLCGLETDSEGNIIATGSFKGANVDFDPGPGTYLLSSYPSSENIFMAKFDPNGELIWAHVLSYIGDMSPRHTYLDENGGIYISGYFDGELDLDPTSGVDMRYQTYYQGSCFFILKMNSSGQYQWGIALGHDSPGYVLAMHTVDRSGNSTLIGKNSGSVDYDPSSNSLYLSEIRVFIRYDSAGNLIFGKTSTSNQWYSHYSSFNIGADYHGNVYLYSRGNYGASYDHGFDTNSYVTYPYSIGPQTYRPFLVKYDVSGNVIWARVIPADLNYRNHMIVSDSGEVYLTSSIHHKYVLNYQNTCQNILRTNVNSPFLVKYNQNGAAAYGALFKTNDWNYSKGHDVAINGSGRIALTGRLDGSIDIDPHPIDKTTLTGQNGDVGFVAIFQETECNLFYICADSVKDGSCVDSAFISIQTEGNIGPDSIWWSSDPSHNDTFLVTATGGFHHVYAEDSIGCIASAGVYVDGPAPDTHTTYNLSVHKQNQLNFVPSLLTPVDFFIENKTCIASPCTLIAKLDSNLTYIHDGNMPNQPDSVHGDTLEWYLASFNYDSGVIRRTVKVQTDTYSVAGDSAAVWSKVTPVEHDADSSNNYHFKRSLIRASFDPNDKSVYPDGECSENYVLKDQTLTYTIRFQNTGTGPAINVKVIDTLDTNLDIESFDVLTSKHKMIAELIDGHIVRFRFDDINLIDSASNPDESQGYVIFRIKAKPEILNSTAIENKVSIYFDYNKPIVTNTTKSTFTENIPYYINSVLVEAVDSHVVAGNTFYNDTIYRHLYYASDGCDSLVKYTIKFAVGIGGSDKGQAIRVYPNPSTNVLKLQLSETQAQAKVEVIDVQGRPIYQTNLLGGRIHRIEHDWPAGIYFLNVRSGSNHRALKLIVE